MILKKNKKYKISMDSGVIYLEQYSDERSNVSYKQFEIDYNKQYNKYTPIEKKKYTIYDAINNWTSIKPMLDEFKINYSESDAEFDSNLDNLEGLYDYNSEIEEIEFEADRMIFDVGQGEDFDEEYFSDENTIYVEADLSKHNKYQKGLTVQEQKMYDFYKSKSCA